MPTWLGVLVFLLIIGFFPKLFTLFVQFVLFGFLYRSLAALCQWQTWDAFGWFGIFCLCVADMPRFLKDTENYRFSWSFFNMRFYYFYVKLGIFWLVVLLTTFGYGHYLGKDVLDAAISTFFILVVSSGAFATKFDFVLTNLGELAATDAGLRSKIVEAVDLDRFSPEERRMAEGAINVAVANFRKFVEPRVYMFALRLYCFGIFALPVACLICYKWYWAVLALPVMLYVPGRLAFISLPKAFEDCWFNLISKDLRAPRERYYFHFEKAMPAITNSISRKIEEYKLCAKAYVGLAVLDGGFSKWSK